MFAFKYEKQSASGHEARKLKELSLQISHSETGRFQDTVPQLFKMASQLLFKYL